MIHGLSHRWVNIILRLAAVWLGIDVFSVGGAWLWGQNTISGGQIAYITRQGVQAQVRVIDRNTGIDQRIISLVDMDQFSWSPDNSLAFTVRRGETSRLLVIDLNKRTLLQVSSSGGFATNPAWSADGRRIAFQSFDASGADIFVVDRNGENLRQLTSGPEFDGEPSWSPDGKYIVFRSTRTGNSDLYIMDLNGNVVNRLTEDAIREERPVWSPDGASIAFTSNATANWNLYVLELQTGQIRRITTLPARDHSWSPDSRHIAFESRRDGQVGIFVVDLLTGDESLMVMGKEGSYSPDWMP